MSEPRTKAGQAVSGRRAKLWMECYQMAGPLLLAPGHFTKGQRQRIRELLLDVLSEPDRFTAKTVRTLYRMALKP